MEVSPALARRRRPAQSRARATTDAIEQAFVQLLVEKGYQKMSIRQLIALAGVGIGSFYEYYASKDALAAICIHARVQKIAEAMRASVTAARGEPLPARADAMLSAQAAAPLAEPEQWAALFLVERQVSGIEAFRKHYAQCVQLWREMLAAGPGWPDDATIDEAAFAAHAMVYSLVSQTLMTRTDRPDADALRRLLRSAVHGYLSVLAPQAYRLHRFDV